MKRLTAVIGASALSLGLGGCALLSNPVGTLKNAGLQGARSAISAGVNAEEKCAPIAKRQVAFDEEHALGGALALNWVARGGGITGTTATTKTFPKGDAKEAQLALNVVGRNLAFQSDRPHLPWTFGIVESDGFNAISAPAGYVFVTRGLLAQVNDEAELAGVLAHEIAHITLKHALTEYQKAMHSECKRSATAGAFSEAASRELTRTASNPLFDNATLRKLSSNAGLDFNKLDEQTRALFKGVTDGLLKTLFDRGYSADDEFAADLVAATLMAQAGYDPEAYVSFLGKLPEGGAALSTAHPKKAERQKRLQEALAAAKAGGDDEGLLPFTALAKQRGPLPQPLVTLQKAPAPVRQADGSTK